MSFIDGKKLTTYNLESRFKAWKFGLTKLAENPLVGIGYGKDNFQRALKDEYASRAAAEPNAIPMAGGLHNNFLDIAVGAGLPAGLAYLWLMWAILKAGWKQFCGEPHTFISAYPLALVIMVAGVFVRNCFDNMWIGTMALLFWVLVGLGLEPAVSRPRTIKVSFDKAAI